MVSVQFSPVAQSCLTLCNPMNHSTPGLPVHHQLLEFTQTHIHRVGDAIQPSHPLSSPSPPALNLSEHRGPFQWVGSFPMGQLFTSGGKSIGASASVSVFLMNSQDRFPLLIWSCSLRDSQESSPAPEFKSINSVLSLLYGPTLISIHDNWKNHSFDYTDLCQQSDVSLFFLLRYLGLS